MKNIIKNKGSVYCNSEAWNAFNKELKKLNPSSIFVINDTNTNKYCIPWFLENYHFSKSPEILTIQEGEQHKNIQTCLSLWNDLSERGADRNSLIINLGGGVITDLGGFVASTYKRGLNFINIPTSILAMVDASLGGKNGVDLGMIKNQVGVINNPNLIIIDTKFLSTLAKRQKTSGYAEMLKHGLIHSSDYWNRVKLIDLTNTNTLEELLWESILIKNDIVSQDPYEKNIRKTLNYGHTLGHAIESYCLENRNKDLLLHGEAIAIGMILTTYISNKLLGFPSELLDDISKRMLMKFPKTSFNSSDEEAIIKLLIYDKKNSNGKVLFVLLKNIGQYKINCEVPNDIIKDAFAYYKNYK